MLSQYRVFASQDCDKVLDRYGQVNAIILDLANNMGNFVDIPHQGPEVSADSVCKRVFAQTFEPIDVDYTPERILIIQRGSTATVCLLLTSEEYKKVVTVVTSPTLQMINFLNVIRLQSLQHLGYDLSGQAVWPVNRVCRVSKPAAAMVYRIQGDEPESFLNGRPVYASKPRYHPPTGAKEYRIQGDEPNKWDKVDDATGMNIAAWKEQFGFQKVGSTFPSAEGLFGRDIMGVYLVSKDRSTKRYLCTRTFAQFEEVWPLSEFDVCGAWTNIGKPSIQSDIPGNWKDLTTDEKEGLANYIDKGYEGEGAIRYGKDAAYFLIRNQRKYYICFSATHFEKVQNLYNRRRDVISPQCKKFIEKSWKRSRVRQAILNSAITISSIAQSEQRIRDHMDMRLPLEKSQMHPLGFNVILYENVFGAHVKSAKAKIDELNKDPRLRYGILGWTPVAQHDHAPASEAWILSTWGPRAQNSTSRMFFETNAERQNLLMDDTLDIIRTACFHVHGANLGENDGLVMVRVSDSFLLSGIEFLAPIIVRRMREYWEKKLLDLAGEFEWLTVRHPRPVNMRHLRYEVAEGATYDAVEGSWELSEMNCDPFGDNSRDGNIKVPIPRPAKAALLIVSDWNRETWIGNSGMQEPEHTTNALVSNGTDTLSHPPSSIDGVSRLGENFVTAAFLHNQVFSSQVTSSSHSQRFQPRLSQEFVDNKQIFDKLVTMFRVYKETFRGHSMKFQSGGCTFIMVTHHGTLYLQPLAERTRRSGTQDLIGMVLGSESQPVSVSFEYVPITIGKVPAVLERLIDDMVTGFNLVADDAIMHRRAQSAFSPEDLKLVVDYLNSETIDSPDQVSFQADDAKGEPAGETFRYNMKEDDDGPSKVLCLYRSTGSNSNLEITVDWNSPNYVTKVVQDGTPITDAKTLNETLYNARLHSVDKQTHERRSWEWILKLVVKDVLWKSSEYQYNSVMVLPKSIVELPNKHLLAYQNMGMTTPNIGYWNDDWTETDMIDAGGPARDYFTRLSYNVLNSESSTCLFERLDGLIILSRSGLNMHGIDMHSSLELGASLTPSILPVIHAYAEMLFHAYAPNKFTTGRMLDDKFFAAMRDHITNPEISHQANWNAAKILLNISADDKIFAIAEGGAFNVKGQPATHLNRAEYAKVADTTEFEIDAGGYWDDPDVDPWAVWSASSNNNNATKYRAMWDDQGIIEAFKRAARKYYIQNCWVSLIILRAMADHLVKMPKPNAYGTVDSHLGIALRDIDGTSVETISNRVQGMKFNREYIADHFVAGKNGDDPVLLTYLGWVKDWIRDVNVSTEKQVETFLISTTGNPTMLPGDKVDVDGVPGHPSISAHSCTNALYVPMKKYNDDNKEDNIDAHVQQHKDWFMRGFLNVAVETEFIGIDTEVIISDA
jgi:hypothetical protein